MNPTIRTMLAATTLFGVTACASAPPPDSSAPPPYVRYVVERDMVVRQAANAGAQVVGTLPAGSPLTAWVEEVGGNWYRLHSDQGNVGYIFGTPFRNAE